MLEATAEPLLCPATHRNWCYQHAYLGIPELIVQQLAMMTMLQHKQRSYAQTCMLTTPIFVGSRDRCYM